MHRAEITTAAPGAPLPMNAIWRTIRSYILWQHERGTLHYDIMVTLILIFIFFSPRVINFNDKPISRNPHPTEVVVTSDAEGHLHLPDRGQRGYDWRRSVRARPVAAYYRADFRARFRL